MTEADIGFLSAVALGQLCRSKALSPVEVTQATLRHLVPPFDNPAIRHTFLAGVNQTDYMTAVMNGFPMFLILDCHARA